MTELTEVPGDLPAGGLRIGDAAAALGVPAHVLRHWEDMGVVRPQRLPSGHRVYDEETVTRARLVRVCQRAGMSLEEIARLFGTGQPDRAVLVAARRDALREQARQLAIAEQFLSHVLECKHPIVSQCPECAAFSRT